MSTNVVFPSAALRRASGEAKMQLLYCPNVESCENQPACTWENHPTYIYMLHLKCSKCTCSWYICTLCDKVPSCYKTLDQVYRHCTRANKNHPANLIQAKQRKKRKLT